MDNSSMLYTAATEALVADASAVSTFEKMVICAYSHSTLVDFTKSVKETEAQIKKDFEITSMPNPWRSAKSVIQSAIKLNISLVDDNGVYLGKTALQTKIKAVKDEESKPEKSVMEYVNHIISVFNSVPVSKSKDVITNIKTYVDTYLHIGV